MLDQLYQNIGTKIKNWAKWIFIVEAIGGIIAAIVMIVTGEDNAILAGWILLPIAPIVAWVSSWLLYAFGQLVEDVHAMRDKEGTTMELKAKREAEEKARREAEEERARRKAEEKAALDPQGAENKRAWNIEQQKQGVNVGTCGMCGSKMRKLVNIEFEDFFGKAKRDLCYDCFCKYNDSSSHQ